MALSAEEKERILRAIEEDREFRYALMGFLGFREILDRIVKLEERQQALEERLARLEERVARLEERLLKVEEALAELIREVRELRKAVGSLGRRFGRRFEALVRLAYQDMIRELGIEPLRVERLSYIDVDGRYVGRGARIEIDVYVHDGRVWLIEVKSFAEPDDVTWFALKASIAERILSRRADRKVLLAVETTRSAVETARRLGVELLAGSVVEDEEGGGGTSC